MLLDIADPYRRWYVCLNLRTISIVVCLKRAHFGWRLYQPTCNVFFHSSQSELAEITVKSCHSRIVFHGVVYDECQSYEESKSRVPVHPRRRVQFWRETDVALLPYLTYLTPHHFPFRWTRVTQALETRLSRLAKNADACGIGVNFGSSLFSILAMFC